MEGVSEIADFFKGKSIFITGATGFMGKVLVEKLLRSCNEVKCIYVLLRPKKGLDVKSRLRELLDVKIFDKIRDCSPSSLNKVLAIEGDITLPGLGISDADLKALVRDVSIVFHSAATVKFDEPLKTSIDFNVLGTRRVIELCHKLPKIVVTITKFEIFQLALSFTICFLLVNYLSVIYCVEFDPVNSLELLLITILVNGLLMIS